MRKLLVTGGAGFIGTNFVHYWGSRHRNDYIVVLDALTYAGNASNFANASDNSRMVFVHGDICDESLLARLFGHHEFDIVVHFAAESHVDRSIAAPDSFVRTNIVGTHALLRAARAAWDGNFAGRRFHHVSTDEVYGSLGPEDRPFQETTPYQPRSPYAASKAGSDFLVRAYSHTYGLPISISNCSNNYGPYQFPEKLIPLMVVSAFQGRPLPIYGDGMNIRDWLHVSDHCAALEAILRHGTFGETYNVGSGRELSNIELVQMICELIDVRFRTEPDLKVRFPDCPAAKNEQTCGLISFIKDRPGHDRRYAIDSTKIRNQLGFFPHIDFNAGLAATIDWYLENEPWWQSIQRGEHNKWLASHYGWTNKEFAD